MKEIIYSLADKLDSNLVGIKAKNMQEISKIGMRIPLSFIISKNAFNKYKENDDKLSVEIAKQILNSVKIIEAKKSKKLGDIDNPLMLALKISPLKDNKNNIKCILNIGLNDNIAANLAIDEVTAKIIYDSYRKYIMTYAKTVKGSSEDIFNTLIDKYKEKRNVKNIYDLKAEDLYQITSEYKKIYFKLIGEKFPQDPEYQLIELIKAEYKLLEKIGVEASIIVEEMILESKAIKGTVYSSSPLTGEDKLAGNYYYIENKHEKNSIDNLLNNNIDIYKQIEETAKRLENEYKDIVKFSFITKDNLIYIVDFELATKTSKANLKQTVNLLEEGIITKEKALTIINKKDINSLLFETSDKESLRNEKPISKGYGINAAALYGQICLTKEAVINCLNKNINPILVKEKLSVDDIDYIENVKGIITKESEEIYESLLELLDKCSIFECQDISVDEKNKIVKINGQIYEEGFFISLDAEDGKIYEGIIKIEAKNDYSKIKKLLYRKEDNIHVISSIIREEDLRKALYYEANGILYRMDYTILKKEKVNSIQKILLLDSKNNLKNETKKYMSEYINILEKIFENKEERTVIKLLDIPLQIFFPHGEESIYSLSKSLNIEISELKNIINSYNYNLLNEKKIDLIKIQAEAIFKAKINAEKKGFKVDPEIILPNTRAITELKEIKKVIKDIADMVLKNKNTGYKIGMIIENPRNCILANKIAKEMDFIIFDLSKLTKSTYGFSEGSPSLDNDFSKFDPLKDIDIEGVGKIITVACKLSKQVNHNIKLGAFGRYNEETKNISFLRSIGINDYYTVPSKVPLIKYNIVRSDVNGN